MSTGLLRTPYRRLMQTWGMEMAERIRLARESKGWSQRQLAAKMKRSPSAIAQWETAATAPTIANRADLSRVLGIPFVDLLPEAGVMGELTVSDPLIAAIVLQAGKLPRQVQEAVLMQLAATVEMTLPAKAPN